VRIRWATALRQVNCSCRDKVLSRKGYRILRYNCLSNQRIRWDTRKFGCSPGPANSGSWAMEFRSWIMRTTSWRSFGARTEDTLASVKLFARRCLWRMEILMVLSIRIPCWRRRWLWKHLKMCLQSKSMVKSSSPHLRLNRLSGERSLKMGDVDLVVCINVSRPEACHCRESPSVAIQ